MGAIELANRICLVQWQSASHSDMLANRLGAKIAGNPRRSISPCELERRPPPAGHGNQAHRRQPLPHRLLLLLLANLERALQGTLRKLLQ